MKTVYFIRHAKSSWKDPSLDDFDRPLNKRGYRDAPFMAKLLRGQVSNLDAIVSSPANRAFTTATYFAEAFALPKSEIVTRKAIYEAYPEEVLEVIQAFPKEWKTALLFGHNPAFNSLANLFSEDPIVNVPTCGIFRVDAVVDQWADFTQNAGRLVEFYYPKQYFT